MTASTRIVFNIVATYGRSLYALAVGLFCSRWTLVALGQTDFGLFGLIGGLITIFGTINSLLISADSRFFAFSMGGVEECRKWFNAALFMHMVFPALVLLGFYAAGTWAIGNWLVIPDGRMAACMWVFRFTCISAFVLMTTVPFYAMFAAKQRFAELTVYGFAQSTLHVVVIYFMMTHPRDWLAAYAGWMCMLEAVPAVLICVRALRAFPECKIAPRQFLAFDRLWKILSYVFWRAFAELGTIFSVQGIQVVANKYFGSLINASVSISNKVLAHAGSLTACTGTAFQPVIASAYGEGDMDKVRMYALRTTKLALVFAAVFAVPLVLEMPQVLELWLKNPPPCASGLCICVLLAFVLEKAAYGHRLAVEASGRIARYQLCLGLCQVAVLLVAWLFVACSFGVRGIGIALMAGAAVNAAVGLAFASRIVGMDVREWLCRTLLPFACITAVSTGASWLLRLNMSGGAPRVFAVALSFEAVFLPLVWIALLDAVEREFLAAKVRKLLCAALERRQT